MAEKFSRGQKFTVAIIILFMLLELDVAGCHAEESLSLSVASYLLRINSLFLCMFFIFIPLIYYNLLYYNM